MSTQHTPGPWELSEGDTSLWAKSPLGARVRISNIIKHSPMNGINHAANARLIAAAPEMLHALKMAADELNKMGCECDCEPLPVHCPVCAVRTAINKAVRDGALVAGEIRNI